MCRSWLAPFLVVVFACSTGTGVDDTVEKRFALDAPPTITVQERQKAVVVLTAIGADDAVTFSLSNAPRFATLDGCVLWLAPEAGEAGTSTFSVTASDGASSDTKQLVVDVLPRPNQEPTCSGLEILNEDFSMPGWDATKTGVVTRGLPNAAAWIQDPDGDAVRLLVEVRPASEPYRNQATHHGALVPSGQRAVVPLTGLVGGQRYHVQFRIEDERGSGMTSFYESGANPHVFTASELPDPGR